MDNRVPIVLLVITLIFATEASARNELAHFLMRESRGKEVTIWQNVNLGAAQNGTNVICLNTQQIYLKAKRVRGTVTLSGIFLSVPSSLAVSTNNLRGGFDFRPTDIASNDHNHETISGFVTEENTITLAFEGTGRSMQLQLVQLPDNALDMPLILERVVNDTYETNHYSKYWTYAGSSDR